MTHTSEETKTLAEEIKRRVQPFLVSRQYYGESLSNLISSDFLDLKVCYYIPDGSGKKILVSNKFLEKHGIHADFIRSQALENIKRSCSYGIKSLDEVFAHIDATELPIPDLQSPFPLYVLTNTNGCLGAAGLLLDGLLANFSELVEGIFFVIPSSIHEVLLIPDGSGLDTESLNEIICGVNSSEVSPQEVLSDHAYYYNRETRQLQTETY